MANSWGLCSSIFCSIFNTAFPTSSKFNKFAWMFIVDQVCLNLHFIMKLPQHIAVIYLQNFLNVFLWSVGLLFLHWIQFLTKHSVDSRTEFLYLADTPIQYDVKCYNWLLISVLAKGTTLLSLDAISFVSCFSSYCISFVPLRIISWNSPLQGMPSSFHTCLYPPFLTNLD